MSMIGYIIGLGDRHLDNVLVDLATGEVCILILKKTLFLSLLSLSFLSLSGYLVYRSVDYCSSVSNL